MPPIGPKDRKPGHTAATEQGLIHGLEKEGVTAEILPTECARIEPRPGRAAQDS